MSRFDFTDRLNFDEIDLTPPNRVISSIDFDLAMATNGIIHVGVEPYEGVITQQKPSFATTFAGMFQKASASYTVVPDMGKLGEEIHQYEIFLYTPSYPNYKFRMMFLRYGLASYPAEIVLEQGVASASMDMTGYHDLLFSVDNREQLEAIVDQVLKTDYIIEIMQELIRVDQMQKYRRLNNMKPIQCISSETSKEK